MKKILFSLLCTATLLYGADVPGLKEVRNSPCLATSFAFFLGSTFRITRLFSIPGAILCGLALFNPAIFTNWKAHFSENKNSTPLFENVKRICRGSMHKAVKKSGDWADRLEKENKNSETSPEDREIRKQKNRPKDE